MTKEESCEQTIRDLKFELNVVWTAEIRRVIETLYDHAHHEGYEAGFAAAMDAAAETQEFIFDKLALPERWRKLSNE